MSAIEPDGGLMQLPRELRDMIYNHCLKKSYLVFWNHYDNTYYHDHIVADLAILRTSKAISSDVNQIIFSSAASKATTFIFDITLDFGLKLTTPPTKNVTDSMTKVKFIVRLDEDMEYFVRYHHPQFKKNGPHSSMKSICGITVDRFADTMFVRESFHIQFHFYHQEDVYEILGDLMRTPFFQTLKRFNGFRKLLVELNWFTSLGTDGNIGTQKEARALQTELMPSLGQSIIKSVVERKAYSFLSFVTLELEFHPLKFHVEKLQAEAARLTEEADTLEGRTVRADDRSHRRRG